jgi:hypothetical protein
LTADVLNKTRVGASRLAESGVVVVPMTLERLREQIGAHEVSLVLASGQVLLTAGGAASAGPPERPSSALMRQARLLGSASVIEGLDDESLAPSSAGPHIRALARVPRNELALAVGDERFLMVLQPIRARWRATRWPCRRPTANTSSVRWAATACAACTSAR